MKLALWLLVSFLPALFSRPFKPGDWYAALPKAPWTPPNLAFPIVWTILYALMGVSAWLAFRDGFGGRRVALILFFVQLVLNGLWSWIFFGKHLVGWAFLDLAVLWGVVLATFVSFRAHSALSGALLVPYILWLTVALSLNGYIWLKLAK